MADNVPRRVLGPVNLRANDGAQVADRNLHRVGDGALRLARDVDGGPREGERRRGVDAARGEEGAHVRDARAGRRVGVAEQDGVPYGAEGGGARDEGSSFVEAFREDGDGQGCKKSKGIGRDREKLSVCGGVS